MVGEHIIYINSNTLVTNHNITLHDVPPSIERIVLAPEKTTVKLVDQTLMQTHSNTVLVGDEEEGFPQFGDTTTDFLGIKDVYVSQVAGQPHRPKNLVALLQQTEEKFGWDVSEVWSLIVQPALGMNLDNTST